jgi:hypothetical protein
VHGDSDSERLFALISKLADEHGGALDRAIADAVNWIARILPVYAINFLLITPDELWALRYPDSDALYVLERSPGGPHGDRHADHARKAPAVVGASERMDEDPGWRLLDPGELIHVDGWLRSPAAWLRSSSGLADQAGGPGTTGHRRGPSRGLEASDRRYRTERAGFEPAREREPPTRLAGECLQPLGHLSSEDLTIVCAGSQSSSAGCWRS